MSNKPPQSSLNLRQERFCEIVVTGVSATEAYKRAGYTGTGNTAEVTACQLLRNPKVKARIAELRKPQTTESNVTKEAKLAFLAAIIRTPIGQIGPDSVLCQEYSTETIDGGTRIRVKMLDKLRALELHSKLVGDFEPEQVAFEPGRHLADIMARAANASAVLSRIGRPGPVVAPASVTVAGLLNSQSSGNGRVGLSRINPAERP